jgi:hypothetical protein
MGACRYFAQPYLISARNLSWDVTKACPGVNGQVVVALAQLS